MRTVLHWRPRHRRLAVSSGPHGTPATRQSPLIVIPNPAPICGDGGEGSGFSRPQPSPRLGILAQCIALTNQCMSDYSLDGSKDSTWLWDKYESHSWLY